MAPTFLSTFFFFNDTATTEIYTLSLHDALPISVGTGRWNEPRAFRLAALQGGWFAAPETKGFDGFAERYRARSEEHTSELQSRQYLVCRLLLEKKKKHPVV